MKRSRGKPDYASHVTNPRNRDREFVERIDTSESYY